MGVETGIQWCHHTWSSWRGCAKVSHGCTNCYADALSKRNPAVLGVWGPNGTRVIAKDWSKPLAWDRAAAKAGERRRIFMSMNDWLEDQEALIGPRGRLLELIHETSNLNWLLLSKRPENWLSLMSRLDVPNGRIGSLVAKRWLQGEPPPNVWVGVSVEDQETADARIPALLDIPAAMRWVSYEPALGPVDFLKPPSNPNCKTCKGEGVFSDPVYGRLRCECVPGLAPLAEDCVSWVVVGGESGSNARPFDLQWARDTISQCRAAGVPVFVKQLGRRPVEGVCIDDETNSWEEKPIRLRDPKGGDMSEWEAGLRVREMPEGGGA